MKPTFAGKTIRCRGCKQPFLVKASRPPAAEAVSSKAEPLRSDRPPAVAREEPQPIQRPPPPPPVIFDDLGDILEELGPGERVPSVVRPANTASRSTSAIEAIATVAAIVLGGLCAIPVVKLILFLMGR